MRIGDLCRRGVVSISNDSDVAVAAQLMRERHVGFLVVYKLGDDIRHPIGVLTDRDIVLEVVAPKIEPSSVTVEDAMSRQPMIAKETDDLADVLQAMRIGGVRRVPVVDNRGALTGIFAIDDALGLMSNMLCDISESVRNGQRQEWRARRELSGVHCRT